MRTDQNRQMQEKMQ